MAIIAVMTTAGENLRTQNLAGSGTSRITRIEADSGHVTTETAAMALTDVVTPFNPVRQTTNPQGRALPSDPVAQFRYLDADAVDYEIKGFGIFAGAVMTHYICDDGGATIYPKVAALILDIGLYITARSGDQSTFTFSADLTAPVATTRVLGLTALVTSAELAAALAGADPAGAIEGKVITLQAIYDSRSGFGAPRATSAQLQAALAGGDPAGAIENNVISLQNMYDRRGDFGVNSIIQDNAPTAQQIAAAPVPTIWYIY